MSLRWRLALVTAALVVLAVGAASTAGYLLTARELRSAIDRSLVEDVRAVAQGGADRRPPRRVGLANSSLQALDRQGEVRAASSPGLPVAEVDRAVAAGRVPGPVLRDVDVDDEPVRMLTVATPDGAVQVGRSLVEVRQSLANLRWRMLTVVAIVAAAAAGIVWLVAGRVSAPIRRLTDAAEHIAGTGDLTAPIAVDRADEVGRLASAFNDMVGALSASRDQQQQLVLDASHELRTPLTTLRTNIELLARADSMPAAERREVLDAATVELGELTSLVTELVDLATERGPIDDAERVEVDLAALVARVVERARRRSGRAIELVGDEAGTVDGIPSLLERALSNLIDNAVKFSPDGTPIRVTARDGVILVDDAGAGIAPEERRAVFERFHRAPEARTTPGSGLGLAIVAQVAAEHGGTVTAETSPAGGARLRLDLSAATDPVTPSPR